MSSGPYRQPRQSLVLFDPFAQHGLPTNESLAHLPPLPETPAQERRAQTSAGPVTSFFNRTLQTITRARLDGRKDTLVDLDAVIDGEEGAASPPPSRRRMDLTTPATVRAKGYKDVFGDGIYPVLSTRQSSFNLARVVSGANKVIPANIPLPPSPVKESPTKIALPGSPIDSLHELSSPIGVVAPRSMIRSPAKIALPDLPLLAPAAASDLQADETHLIEDLAGQPDSPEPSTLSDHPPRPISVNIEAGLAMAPAILPPSARPTSPSIRRPPNQTQSPSSSSRSASLLHPAGLSDVSLLRDCSIGIRRESYGNETFELDIAALRPGRKSGTENDRDVATVRKAAAGPDLDRFPGTRMEQHLLDQSTLLPFSPAKYVDLLSSTNALARVEAPWTGTDSIFCTQTTQAPESLPFPADPKSIKLPRDSASSASQPQPKPRHASSPSSSMKSKRLFPASNSAQSLASVGEEPEHVFAAGDKSALLPVSPAKLAHYLCDEEMLMREELMEGPSICLAPPPTSKRSTEVLGAASVPTPVMRHRVSPEKRTPIKQKHTPLGMRGVAELADMTLDVRDLMARMSKPKRASGTEESFVDLLHGEDMLEVLDDSIGEDSFLPAGLRPMARSKSISRLESKRSSPIKASPIKTDISPSKPIPVRQSRYEDVDSPYKMPSIKSFPSGKMSGRELRAEQSIAKPLAIAGPIGTPRAARPRVGIAPMTTGSKRVSLSAGALLLPSNASHREMLFPKSRLDNFAGDVVPTDRAPGGNLAAAASIAASKRDSLAPVPAGGRGNPAKSAASLTSRQRVNVVAKEGMDGKSRAGSTTTIGSTGVLRPATTAITSTLGRTAAGASAAGLPRHSTRPAAATLGKPAPVTASARPAGLPRPGIGPTARSAPAAQTVAASAVAPPTQMSRPFGTDGSGGTNRLSRPTTLASLAPGAARVTKASMGPVAIPSKRPVEPNSSTVTKSRALSTPAKAMTSTNQSIDRPPAMPAPRTGSTRPVEPEKRISAAPSSGGSALDTSRVPATTSAGSIARGSTLPRPTARATTTGGKPSGASGGTMTRRAAGLQGLRDRLDNLAARQQAGRAGR